MKKIMAQILNQTLTAAQIYQVSMGKKAPIIAKAKGGLFK